MAASTCSSTASPAEVLAALANERGREWVAVTDHAEDLTMNGLSRDEKVARRQRRFNPIQRRLGGGCRLDRDHWELLTDAGFELRTHAEFYGRGPRIIAAYYRGVAVKPG